MKPPIIPAVYGADASQAKPIVTGNPSVFYHLIEQ